MDGTVHEMVDGLFRRESARLVSMLVGVFGPDMLRAAEDVVQESLLEAMRQWPYRGVPENPSAWLWRVARNRAVDVLRARAATDRSVERLSVLPPDAPPLGEDDELRMLFLCCHPAIPRPAQVALTLKTMGGLSVPEIARGLRSSEKAVAQRLVRAKRAIRESGIPFELPSPEAFEERLDTALQIIYLLFNEGYSAGPGENLVRAGLCEDAIYLATLTARHTDGDRPVVHALLAMMLFHAARLPARANDAGDLLLLEEQDRSRWDKRLIACAFDHLGRSQCGEVTRYHLEAGIAASHAAAPSWAATNWVDVCGLYEDLVGMTKSPVAQLNAAIAAAMCDGPARGLQRLEPLRGHAALKDYHLLHAAEGYFLTQLGRTTEAVNAYEAALKCPCSEPERRFLSERVAKLNVQVG